MAWRLIGVERKGCNGWKLDIPFKDCRSGRMDGRRGGRAGQVRVVRVRVVVSVVMGVRRASCAYQSTTTSNGRG